MTPAMPQRPIRSYVLRQGRLTQGQSNAMQHLWPVFGVEYNEQHLSFANLFQNDYPTILEIGFGNGQSLSEMALQNPQTNFLGIEVHLPGVGRLMNLIEQSNLQNLRVSHHDAVEVVRQQIPLESLERIQIYFPDPWHKKRHNKRRLIQTPFLKELTQRLKKGGLLHIATDWEDYAHHIHDALQQTTELTSTHPNGQWHIERPEFRPQTKFESRGLNLGHDVWDFLYQKDS